MKNEDKTMTVMSDIKDCPKYILFSLLNEDHAYKIHSQTLARLNERGGMSPFEIVLNIERKSYRDLFNEHDVRDNKYWVNRLNNILRQVK